MSDTRDTAFQDEQFDAIYPLGVERHYWNRCRISIIADRLKAIGAKGPMLEVGSGKGLVVAALRERGFDITGIELARIEAIPEAKPYCTSGVDVMSLSPQQCAPVRSILLLDVIEHIEDAAGFMAALWSKFPNLDWMVITVPARQELFSNYDEFNGHFRRYDLRSLREHADPDQKRIWKAGYFFHSLYPAAWLQLRLGGARRTYFSVPALGIASTLHTLLGRAFHLESRLLPDPWRGTSIIACAGKRA